MMAKRRKEVWKTGISERTETTDIEKKSEGWKRGNNKSFQHMKSY